MKASKVFIFPSTREGFGIVALEANAAGIPVITTNHVDNATKELIVNNKNGFVIQLDETTIANHTNIFLKTQIKSLNSFVHKYDWNNLVVSTEKVYLS